MVKSFYLDAIVYYIAGISSFLFVLSYFYPGVFQVAGLTLLLLVIAVVVDAVLVYSKKSGITATRVLPDRFSIGDSNNVFLQVENHYGFPVRTSIIDEL